MHELIIRGKVSRWPTFDSFICLMNGGRTGVSRSYVQYPRFHYPTPNHRINSCPSLPPTQQPPISTFARIHFLHDLDSIYEDLQQESSPLQAQIQARTGVMRCHVAIIHVMTWQSYRR